MTLLPRELYRTVTLPQGTLRYADVGNGPPLLFVHGIFASSVLWRKVVPLLQDRFRCIVPDLPLGAHTLPMPNADLSPHGVAQLLADFMAALDLRDVTLVGNDSGGALCQFTVVQHPERIARVVLTNCDAFEAFPPRPLIPLTIGPRWFGARFVDGFATLLPTRLAQRMLLALASQSTFTPEELDAYYMPLLTDKAVRHDLTRFLQQVHQRDSLAVAQRFGQVTQPVHIVWGQNDWIFSARLARRLQRALPYATLQLVPGSRAFVPEDQPMVLAREIAAFVEEPVAHAHSVGTQPARAT